MTTVRQLSIPAFGEGGKVGVLRHCSYLFVIFWRAAPYLAKIVWQYLLGSC